jgi:hypothetical protein
MNDSFTGIFHFSWTNGKFLWSHLIKGTKGGNGERNWWASSICCSFPISTGGGIYGVGIKRSDSLDELRRTN